MRDPAQSYLALAPSEEGPEDSMNQLQGHSITYRIAVGLRQGRKIFTLQTLSGTEEPFVDTADGVVGFSLHASVAVKVSEDEKLERICRYISRPAVSEKRLSLTGQGKVRYELKTPYRDGTTGRPSAQQQTSSVGHAGTARQRQSQKHRTGGQGKSRNQSSCGHELHAKGIKAQRLKRVSTGPRRRGRPGIDVERCRVCGGKARVIAAIEDKAIIDKILTHLGNKMLCAQTAPLPPVRALPAAGLFR